MKCPRCWTDRAYVRPERGWRRLVTTLLLVRPMRCHHCFHTFYRLWLQTIGQRVLPPLRIAPATREHRLSHAAKQYATMQQGELTKTGPSGNAQGRSADAA